MIDQEESEMKKIGTKLGAKLKEAREAKGLDVKQTAKALRFKPEMLVALESDDYTDMRSEVFARGYLKSYARLLGLSEDEVLTEFDAENYAETIASHKPEFIEPEPYAIKNTSFRWFSYLLLIVLIGLVVWWLHNHAESSKIISNLPATNHLKQLNQKPQPQELEIKSQHSQVDSTNAVAKNTNQTSFAVVANNNNASQFLTNNSNDSVNNTGNNTSNE